jgi:tetratricopeptide (TPR) repeat protein
MVAVDEALETARKHQRAGNLRQAEEVLRARLKSDPQDARAWHLLGDIAEDDGRGQEAIAAFRQVIGLQPNVAEGHCRLGNLLAGQGRKEEAIGCLRRALELAPDHIEAHINLGITLGRLGRVAEAVSVLEKAVRLRPDYARAHNNLCAAYLQNRQPQEALGSADRALQLQAQYPEAHYNRGNAQVALGRYDEAAACFRQALALRPNYAEAYLTLGSALTELDRPDEAVPFLQQATRLTPDAPVAHNCLGLALADLGRFDEAVASYQEALRLQPQSADFHSNLGSAYMAMQRLPEALASYEIALLYQPQTVSARWNRSLALLLSGDWERGLVEYEWRWKRPQTPMRSFDRPMWDGSPLSGRTILLWTEQGIGDTIQFVRYATLVKERGGTVILQCPPYLRRLLSRAEGVDRVMPEGELLPAFDVQAPLMSLPRLFGTTLTSIPARVPYLSPEPERVEQWRQRLGDANGKLRVGILWQGNRFHQWNRYRSVRLAEFAPIAALENVRLISLQKEPGADQIKTVASRFKVEELSGEWDTLGDRFVDSAAIMPHLDLVICCDTSIAHLAGALGVPVWIALSFQVDWRWLLDREDSPWYPTMRLFRQERLGEWRPVFTQMAQELQRRTKE